MEEFHGSLAIDFCRHKPPLVIRVWTWVSKVVLLHSQRRSFYTERSHVPAWEGKKTFIYISVQQLATLKLSPYCRHDNTKTMSVRVHAVTRQQKATAEEKIEEESETDGAEREESSEGMCRLEFKFIVKKKKTLLEIGLGTFQPDKVVQRGNGTRITEGVGFDWWLTINRIIYK